MFSEITAEELAVAFMKYPIIIKSVLSLANVAGRAIKRDLGFDIDTYGKSISVEKANQLAGFVKPQLPKEMAIPALIQLDTYMWVDKELRANKGNWEITVTKSLNDHALVRFRKRHLKNGENVYEIDAAYPPDDKGIEIGIDIKRIESPRDIHKRADEIINKAVNLKAVFPKAKFYAMIYYPFPHEHGNVRTRLDDKIIDGVFFAGEGDESIDGATCMLLGKANLLREKAKDDGEHAD